MQFGTVKLKACKYGWMLYAGKYIGTCFDLYGQYSESEVAVMRSFLGDGSVAFDIGANIGDLTLPMAKMVGETGRVYAVESHPEAFNILCANLALNGVKTVRPINAYIAATSDAERTAGAWGLKAYTGDVWEPSYVTLDSFEVPRCDLIKVDVDGAELEILQSGAMLIEKHRPILYFENDHQATSPNLLDFVMATLGYTAYWHPAPIFDPQNYFGNPDNHWAPNNVVSLMVLAIPKERGQAVTSLGRVAHKDEWWPGMAK